MPTLRLVLALGGRCPPSAVSRGSPPGPPSQIDPRADQSGAEEESRKNRRGESSFDPPLNHHLVDVEEVRGGGGKHSVQQAEDDRDGSHRDEHHAGQELR